MGDVPKFEDIDSTTLKAISARPKISSAKREIKWAGISVWV